MATDPWANLPKSSTDATTIEQAVSAALAAHDADPNAHMQALGSLAEHREADIIDHKAESIYNDKLVTNARAFVAIVDTESAADFTTVEAAIEYAQSVGGGTVYIKRGVYVLSGDIKMLPTVSLQGEGIRDTIIYPADGEVVQIQVDTAFTPLERYIADLEGTAGDTYFTNPTESTWDSTPTPGAYLQIAGDGIDTMFAVLVDAGPENIVIDQEIPNDCTGVGIIAWTGCAMTNGSKTVQLLGEQTCSGVGVLPGMKLTSLTGNFTTYVNSIVDDTHFVVADECSDATGNYGVQISYEGKHAPRFNDITFGTTNAGIQLNWTSGVQQVVVDRCEFSGGASCIAKWLDGGNWQPMKNAAINNCIFDCPPWNRLSYGAAVVVEDSNVDNCIFRGALRASTAIYAVGRCNIMSCDFLTGGDYENHWITVKSGGTTIDGNNFESCGGEPFSAGEYITNYRGMVFSHNNVLLKSNKKFEANVYSGLYADNYITSTGAGDIEISMLTTNTRFIGNVVKGNITNNGTNCLVANNLKLV